MLLRRCADSYWTLLYIPMVLSKALKWQGLKRVAVPGRYTHPLGNVQAQVSSKNSGCGVRSWPWHWFVMRKADRLLLVASNRCIPVKNTLDWRADAYCACKITRLFSVLFCELIAVHKFDFRLVIKETPNKRRPEEKGSCSDKESCFLHNLYVVPGSWRDCRGTLQMLCRSAALSWVKDGTSATFGSFIVPCIL
jgi:hypothetical protein